MLVFDKYKKLILLIQRLKSGVYLSKHFTDVIVFNL
jgi:hypothetical protein